MRTRTVICSSMCKRPTDGCMRQWCQHHSCSPPADHRMTELRGGLTEAEERPLEDQTGVEVDVIGEGGARLLDRRHAAGRSDDGEARAARLARQVGVEQDLD